MLQINLPSVASYTGTKNKRVDDPAVTAKLDRSFDYVASNLAID